MKKLLEQKYGKQIVNILVNKKNEVVLNHVNKDGELEQEQVMNHIKSLMDENDAPLVPTSFFANNVEWGFDFSGWIGPLQNKKKYILIGAEPNIDHNYQVVYGFGSKQNIDTSERALELYNTEWSKTTRDIWNIVADNFTGSDSINDKIDFISNCYMTDLCHFVPKNCGTINSICSTLGISASEWKKLRSKTAKLFLKQEILTLNPELIILHGNAARDFFNMEFKPTDTKEYQVKGSKFRITESVWNNYKMIGIPHLSGDVRNKLWKCNAHKDRPIDAKNIIQNILYPDNKDTKTTVKVQVKLKKEVASPITTVKNNTKYINIAELESHLNKIEIQYTQKQLTLKMLNDLDRDYFIKTTDKGFTLYASKMDGTRDQLFANFFLNKHESIEVRFLYHGFVEHRCVSVLPEQKNGKLTYLLNKYVTDLPFVYDETIKRLMHDSFDVVHKGEYKAIRDNYK